MHWRIMATSTQFKADKLAEQLASNTAAVSAPAGYAHAFLQFCTSAAFTGTTLILAEFSNQEVKYYLRAAGKLTANDVAGYFAWPGALAVCIAQGSGSFTNGHIAKAGESFLAMVKASKALKRGYPLDCLGYCCHVIEQVTGTRPALPVKKDEKSDAKG